MGANAKPRKRYQPRGIVADSVAMAIQGARPLGAIDIASFLVPLRGAVAAIIGARSQREDWICLFDAINTAEQLLPLLTTGRDWRDWLDQTQCDVLDAYDAAALSDDQAQALHGVADVFADLLGVVTRQQMLAAQERAARKVAGALASGRYTRVIDPAATEAA